MRRGDLGNLRPGGAAVNFEFKLGDEAFVDVDGTNNHRDMQISWHVEFKSGDCREMLLEIHHEADA